MVNNETMTDVAYNWLKKRKREVDFSKIWDEIVKTMDIPEDKIRRKKAQFYSDLMLDNRFASLENNKRDLRNRRKFEEVHIDTSEIELEDDELEEYDKEDGMWQVEIYARLKADNGQYFTTEELLFKLHNLMANKELGDHVFFENLAYDDHEFEADDAEDVDDDDEGTPVFVVWLGS